MACLLLSMTRGSRKMEIRTRRGQQGFTATELLVAVMVLLIIVAAATPFLLGTIQNYRLRGGAWQVAGDLRLARQKAVSWGKSYRFTFKNKNASSDPNSYLIERNEGGSTWTSDPANRIYLQTPGGPTYIMIDPSSTPSGTPIVFSANGTVTPTGTIKLIDARGKSYEIVINSVGRVRVTKL